MTGESNDESGIDTSDMNQDMREYIERNEPVSLTELESEFGETASEDALILVDKNKVSIDANWNYRYIDAGLNHEGQDDG